MAREKYLVDTNIIIEALRGNKYCLNFLKSKAIAIAKITVKELYQKKDIPQKERKNLIQFLQIIWIISPDNKILSYYGLLKPFFIKHGIEHEQADRLIAATALAKHLPLATLNKKHFSFIKGLKLVDL